MAVIRETKRYLQNRDRTDGTFCYRCGEQLKDPAKTRWLVLGNRHMFYATHAEADATGHNQGEFPFGSACAREELRWNR